jgi:predicted Rossmann fold nucleotide-binding protein DprA/Smf involved in DNA uptake
MTRVGVTGHRDLTTTTQSLVAGALAAELSQLDGLRGISSLAEGADQIFAQGVLDAGGALIAVIPCATYGRAFSTEAGVASYRALRARADEVIELPYLGPSEDAFWAAGRRIVGLADVLLAIWDGSASGGLGGTADVVAFAREHDVPTTVVWPVGSRRG